MSKAVFSFFIAVSSISYPWTVVAAAPQLEMWRIDCGEMIIDDISYFSDTHFYDGQSATISNGCYLIRHRDQYLLWDAGISRDYLGNEIEDDGWTSSITVTIVDQLREIGLTAEDIDFLGISHFHGDHIGQANDFANARLLINRADADWIRENPPGNARRRLAPWFEGDSDMYEFAKDYDVFGDGLVTILATPGHTPGHGSLLVRLPETGPVLLTGDLYHFRSEVGARNVSRWNTSRADTLASIERFSAIVETIEPTIIVQHEPADIGLLPAFPEAAR